MMCNVQELLASRDTTLHVPQLHNIITSIDAAFACACSFRSIFSSAIELFFYFRHLKEILWRSCTGFWGLALQGEGSMALGWMPRFPVSCIHRSGAIYLI